MPPKLSKEVCKTKLQKKIKKNISEMKTSKRYTTPKQAVAVAYSQLEDKCDFPLPMKGKKSVKGGWSWSDFGEGFVDGFTKTLPIAMTLTGLGVKKPRGRPRKVKGGMFGNIDFPYRGEDKPDTPAQAEKRARDLQAYKDREAERKSMEENSYSYEDAKQYEELMKQFTPEEQAEIMRLREEAVKGGMCGMCEMKMGKGKKKAVKKGGRINREFHSNPNSRIPARVDLAIRQRIDDFNRRMADWERSITPIVRQILSNNWNNIIQTVEDDDLEIWYNVIRGDIPLRGVNWRQLLQLMGVNDSRLEMPIELRRLMDELGIQDDEYNMIDEDDEEDDDMPELEDI